MYERPRLISRIVMAQCAALVVWIAVAVSGAPPWAAAAAAAATAVLMLLRVRGLGVIDAAMTLLRYRFPRAHACAEIRDAAQPTGRPIGLRWDGTQVTAVVEVLAPAGVITLLARDRADSSLTLPLGALSGCLRRHDVTLDGIDVVVHGRRVLDATPAGQVYAQLIGPLPAAAMRTVWVALRLDASTCRDAVDRRGGGARGATRTITASARRVVRALSDSGCEARLLTAQEIRSAALRITHGADPLTAEESWRHVRLPTGYSTGGVLDPRRLDARTLTEIWTHPSLSSTVTVRMRPGSFGTTRVGGLVRYTTRTHEAPLASGVRTVHGREREVLLASLPYAANGLEDITDLRSVGRGSLDELALPVAGCGQLIGSDESGRAVAVRLTGPGVDSVHVAGELYLAQQIVFRAVAVGARVVIHTDRADAWRPLLNGAASPDRLRIAGEYPDDREFDTVVFDGVRPTGRRHPGTIHVHAHPDQWPRESPTIAIEQPNGFGNRIVLTTHRKRMTLTLVTIAAESAHIGRPRTMESVSSR
ncbi:type VII secretion protein EccE [Rhodococcus sp. F64268]|uniref:type VII secretion protein EccE n=1 Tax=unclassified Rhodococcus (in: high G+C Gram-positive bacteria) TaxID=192944 RepID=UPI001FF1209D|nr:type VII secretion protein EccE [Rhodococcus sp. F64268]MCK0093289.1 type VII secretion protein EccE [Rhodococcus sp. F64268]